MTAPTLATQSRVANAGLALLVLLLFFGTAELVCRVVDLRPRMGGATANPPWLQNRWLLPRDDYREAFAAEGFLGRYYEVYEWDRFRFYRLRPDRDVDFLDVFTPQDARESSRWTVQTGPQGWRNAAFTQTPTPGTRRVIALGDSSTFGWGVGNDEAYPARLEAALRRRSTGHGDWEVLNFGVPGYSTFQGLVTLEREALPLAPDVVTWSYLSNDGAMTGEADAATHAQRAGFTGVLLEWLHRSRAYETLEAWIARVRRGSAGGVPPEPSVRNVASYDEAARNARAAVSLAQQAGVPIVLVANCIRGAVSEVLASVARETGTPFLDATALVEAAIPGIAADPAFAAERAELRTRYGDALLADNPRLYALLPDNCHPNAIGHRLIGDALAEIVARAATPAGASTR